MFQLFDFNYLRDHSILRILAYQVLLDLHVFRHRKTQWRGVPQRVPEELCVGASGRFRK